MAADDTQFERRFYGGGSVVASQLEPDTNVTGYGVADNKSAGYSVNLGYDITPHWSAEVYYTDLGEASIDRNSDDSIAGEIAYQHMGVSAIGYAWNLNDAISNRQGNDSHALERREGLSVFGRVGLGLMDNSTDLPYERVNDMHMHLGGGLEYGFENGFAARAEVVSYDTDALAMQVGLVKRFGSASSTMSEPRDVYEPVPQVQRVQLSAPLAPVATPTPPPAPRKQVQKVVVRLPYVFFASDKSDLTGASMEKLQILAATMKRYPTLRLLVNGHTDSISDDKYNLGLSFRRAAAVKRYLMSQGINPSRLETAGSGEGTPITSNQDKRGRAQNRRVEFKILQKQRP
ncbi:unnamed protein product, partial [Cyprideis torosa]